MRIIFTEFSRLYKWKLSCPKSDGTTLGTVVNPLDEMNFNNTLIKPILIAYSILCEGIDFGKFNTTQQPS